MNTNPFVVHPANVRRFTDGYFQDHLAKWLSGSSLSFDRHDGCGVFPWTGYVIAGARAGACLDLSTVKTPAETPDIVPEAARLSCV